MHPKILNLLKQGISAHEVGNVQEADRCYTSILKLDPEHPDANHNMGVLATGIGQVQESLPFFQTALLANPKITQFWLSYIDALITLNRVDEARRMLGKAKSHGFEGHEFQLLKERLSAEKSSNEANNRSIADSELQKILNLYNNGQYAAALEIVDGVSKSSNSLMLLNIKGALLSKLKKYELSILAYKEALAREPNYVDVHNNLGVALKEQGKLDEAIKAFDKAIFLKPNYAEAYNNLGSTLQEMGKLEQALDAFTKAISCKANYCEAHNNIGIVRREMGELDEATLALNAALKINPNYAEAHNNLGITLTDQRKLDDAILSFTKALKLNPDYAEAHNSLGIALEKQGKLFAALDAYSGALSKKPDYFEAMANSYLLKVQLSLTKSLSVVSEFSTLNQSFPIWQQPKIFIYQSINSFLNEDYEALKLHLKNYKRLDDLVIAKLEHKDQVFCLAYYGFLNKLLEARKFITISKKSEGVVFHLGESHCLSYAHQHVKIMGKDYRVKPMITFGAKAFHFSQNTNNAFKSITKANFQSLPNSSKVFISFGEIDCRLNEGFITAAFKTERPINELITNTVKAYVKWFSLLNETKGHNLFFLNIPAPIYKESASDIKNQELLDTIRTYNNELSIYAKKFNFNVIDVYTFTTNEYGFSNGKYHIDNFHLGPAALAHIEDQIN